MPVIREPLCSRCGRPVLYPVERCRECAGRRTYFNSARALWLFDGPAREVVHALKYRNHRLLTARLGPMLARLLDVRPARLVVTWVPLSRHGRWTRGFNQSKLLAIHAARALGVPAKPLLVRRRPVAPQTSLRPGERRVNVRDAFAVPHGSLVSRLHVVLIDDVYTTGSTAAECSRALKRAGARTVSVLTVARTPRPVPVPVRRHS